MKVQPYDALIYLTPLENVPLKENAKNFQMRIDAAFKLILAFRDIFNCPVYTVSLQNKEERNQKVYDIVKQVMKL